MCINSLSIVLVVVVFCQCRWALADGSNVNVETGWAEANITHHLFGGKDEELSDRVGDKYSRHVGLLGNSDTTVNVLGNHIEKKHHLIGGDEIQGTSILGDKIESKRTLLGFGRRETTVDLRGVSSLVNSLFSDKSFNLNGIAGAKAGDTQPINNAASSIPQLNSAPAYGPVPAR
jgi:hypothetical protein